MKNFQRKKVIGGIVLLVCLVTFSSCGFFLYPERRGQTGGQIDATVFLLDLVGCCFFLVPGLIAFAVDFTSGTIYLPGGDRSEIEVIHADKAMLTKDGYIESIVSTHLGKKICLDSNSTIMLKPNPNEDVKASISYLNGNINDYTVVARFLSQHGQEYAFSGGSYTHN
jgi:hypothetical protein